MKLIEKLEKITKPFKDVAITIGNFDGVHLGHRVLFRKVVEKANEFDGVSIVMTFEPHPIKVLTQNGGPPLITMYKQKAELIEESGIDVLICIPFTKQFAAISAKEFVQDILVTRIGMKAIIVGEDYAFGKNREGNLDFLKKHGDNLDFEVIILKKLQDATTKSIEISSTKVRELVSAGNVEQAKSLLGRRYQIRGKVAHGRDRGGRLLGFPTANIKLYDELCPKIGVYAVTVECLGQTYKGVANIGYSPTFDDNDFTVEVHLLDFDGDIYGKTIRVNFANFLRDEKKFSSVDELSKQIEKDIKKARKFL